MRAGRCAHRAGVQLGGKPAFKTAGRTRPAAVIPSHSSEEATEGGKLKAGSRTADFVRLVKGRKVHLSLSGRTMEFDGKAKCVAGC